MTQSSLERDIQMTELPNGVRVITEPMPSVRSVEAGFWIGTGSRCETPKTNGISHFIEHMLFKGTPTRSAEQIAREMDSIGGNLDAFTGRDLAGYTMKVLDEHLDFALGMPIIGNGRTTRSFNASCLREHHRKHHSAANLIVTAAGNLCHERVIEL